jgi:glucose/arabinose dehydrogenase
MRKRLPAHNRETVVGSLLIRGLMVALLFSLLAFIPVEIEWYTVPTWPSITLSEVASGFSSPVHLTHAGDGSGRIFVVERSGRIKILGGGTFLDIAGIVQGGGEEGLLSVAFPPNYATSGYFYVYFTDARTANAGNYDNVLARFSVSSGDPNLADPASEEILMIYEHPIEANHNGGQIAFGPDGYLYIATGDGGGGGDLYENAQDLGSELGKILRINVGGASAGPPPPGPYTIYLPLIMNSGGLAYLIPPDNPFLSDPTALDEIWAYGLRNPWRFSFDRLTGDLWIGDVGQGAWEEIDRQPAASAGGENYGWDCREGAHDYTDPNGDFNTNCGGLTFVDPIHEYDHTLGCSVTGGFVYRGTAISALQGIYLFADYCSGRVWGLQNDAESWVSQELTNGGFGLVSFGENEAGELFLARLDGKIFQVIEATP